MAKADPTNLPPRFDRFAHRLQNVDRITLTGANEEMTAAHLTIRADNDFARETCHDIAKNSLYVMNGACGDDGMTIFAFKDDGTEVSF